MKTRIIQGFELQGALCKALGIDPSGVTRIVIDADAWHPVRVYIEEIGDDRLLNINWAGTLKETSMKLEEKDNHE